MLGVQELWAKAPPGNQRITVAQALPSTAAMQSDAAVEPKMEPKQKEHAAAEGDFACPKQEQEVMDTAPHVEGPKSEPEEDDGLQLVAVKPPHKQGAKAHAGIQTTMQGAFATPHTDKRKPVADSRCPTPDFQVVTRSGAVTHAEQNSAPNGQTASGAINSRPDSHHVEVVVKPEPGHAELPVLQPQPTAQQPPPHAPLLDAPLPDTTMAAPALPNGLVAPWPPAQTLPGSITHGCHAHCAATASPLPARSQFFSQTPVPANLSDNQLSSGPVMLPLGGTGSHPGSQRGAAHQSSWRSNSMAVPGMCGSSCQPPTKAQRLHQAGDAEPNKYANAPALHPADVQLLESGFLDSDSEEDAAGTLSLIHI